MEFGVRRTYGRDPLYGLLPLKIVTDGVLTRSVRDTAALLGFFVTGWAGSTLLPRYEWVFLWVAIGMMYGMLARRPAS